MILTLIGSLLLLGPAEADSLRTTDIEEVVVVSTPKEQQRLRCQPLSSTSLSSDVMRESGIRGIKSLSAEVPNLFIPDYGSRLTTSVYVRGVGSRTGTPAVALYVDGVPQVSSASYDFNFSDVDRVDVLRGPQSTLYGRNSMGGVIRVFTKNPMHYQGTDVLLDAGHAAASLAPGEGGKGRGRMSLTHYHRISERFAFSANLFADLDGGYFRNLGRGGELMDDQTGLGARMRFILRPSETLHFDLSASHEWLRQGGYPYEYLGETGTPSTPRPATQVGQIAYNSPSGYRRSLTNLGLTAEKTWENLTLTSTTGLQHLRDHMQLDQDFTTTDLYTLHQRQRAITLSEEVVLKPTAGRREAQRYTWLLGVSAFSRWLSTEAPVTFRSDGLAWLNGLVNLQGNSHLPTVTSYDATGQPEYQMNFLFDNQIVGAELAFPGTYKTPVANAAVFHQSTLRRLFGIRDLSLTAGLRLDFEHFVLDHDARFGFTQRYGLGGRLTYPDGSVRDGMTLVPSQAYEVSDALTGRLSDHYLQLLPRVALQWQLPATDFVAPASVLYATVSRGYRSGGYNVQMFSDLLQARMQTAIMHNVAAATVPVVDAVTMIPQDVKQNVRELLIGMGTQQPTDVAAATWYKPETSWNYEAGTHLNLLEDRLRADLSVFWMETRDQQVSQMSAGGLGRVTLNSGRSRSIGGEAAFRVHVVDGLTAQASYGYTKARFLHSGYVPFVPRHTFSAGATREWAMPRRFQQWLHAVRLHAGYRAAGPVYWTESNAVRQPFAGSLDVRLTLLHESPRELPASLIPGQQQLSRRMSAEVSAYATNVLSTRRQVFYFETMSRGFAQYSRPAEVGLQLRLKL